MDPMNPEEFAVVMASLVSIPDPQFANAQAIGLMCSLLEQFGYHKGVELYNDYISAKLL